MSDTIGEAARARFRTDFNCAQSVLVSVLEAKGLLFGHAPSVAVGFGGGIGHEGLVCGAVTGAVMALGIIQSQRITDNKRLKEETYDLVQEFMTRFRKDFGSIICNDLTGIDIKDEKQLNSPSAVGIFETVCMNVVGRAADIVSEMSEKLD